jgi:hypothetical protein
MNGFSITTSKKHSGTRSYKSRYSNYDVSSMTSKHPLPVEIGGVLDFWIWHDIESNWDFGFVEVSKDQRVWVQLDAYTGSSGGWKHKQYSLDAFAEASVYVRFRYTTDANTQGSGLFVDDIHPVPDFAAVTTLSSNITAHHFDLTGKTSGTYHYRVKGYSPSRGWGDFSTLEATKVEIQTGPEIYSVTPPEGPMMGLTAVTVSGSGFSTTPQTAVTFGDETASNVIVVNTTTLTCDTPSFPHPGFVDVAVSDLSGTGTLEEGFEYHPDPGALPMNMTDKDTLNLAPPVDVNFYVTGNGTAAFVLCFSFGGGPNNTPFGVMGLDPPLVILFTAVLNAKGYVELPFSIPPLGPMEFYLQALVDHGSPVWAIGGNNPNGSGSVKFVLP